MLKWSFAIAILAFMTLLSACNQESGSPASQDQTARPGTTAVEEDVDLATAPSVEATQEEDTSNVAADGGESEAVAASPTAGPLSSTTPVATATPQPEPTGTAPLATIEVTYFTPPQGEGPYYTVDKPADRDNDLTDLQGASDQPAGDVIEFGGRVYDATGRPMPGILIEIWQTDASGIYLHPGDPDTDRRDPNFQFYGEAVTAADGTYTFRTILPGRYEPRPRHIHVKVKLDGQELLTTQFYFAGDPELAGESMFNQIGPDGERLVILLGEARDGDGNPIFVGQRDVVLNFDLSSQ